MSARTHGRSRTQVYKVWTSMLQRCENSNSKDYAGYGARGVGVCASWHAFESFIDDMGERPPGMTLERRNNSLGYSPENCLWATPAQQAANRRTDNFARGERHPRCVLSSDNLRRIAAMRLGGASIVSIASALGVSRCTVRRGCGGTLGVDYLDPVTRERLRAAHREQVGRYGRNKLTREQRSQIASMVLAGGSQREVGERFGVSQSMVGKIVRQAHGG